MKTLVRLLLGLFIIVCIVDNIWHPRILRSLSYEKLGTWHSCRLDLTNPMQMVCREGELSIEWSDEAVRLTK